MKKKYITLLIALMIIVLSISVIACKTTGLEQKLFDRSKISRSSIDKEVTVGDIIWKVENAEYLGSEIPSDTGFVLESTYGRFIGIEFSVENIGQDNRTIIDLKVIDSRGREFPICAAVYAYIGTGEACLLVDVFPEVKQTFFASFDVPIDSVDLILEVSDLGSPPEEKAYIDLGL
jgi:hypothetical protein